MGTQRARQVAERGGWDQQHLADRALGQTSHLFLVLESNATQVTLGSGRHGACVVREQKRKEEEGEEEGGGGEQTDGRKAGRKEKRERHVRTHKTTTSTHVARGGFVCVLVMSYFYANGGSLYGAETVQKKNQGLKKGPEEPVDKNKRVRHQF